MASERGVQLVKSYIAKRPIYEKSWAIVVGINEYSGGHNRLANAVNDAKAVAQVLRDTHHFEEVHMLCDGEATQRAIMSWLRDELPSRTHEHDRLIFFFAGHGVTQIGVRGDRRGYLVPSDAESGRYVDYIEMRELLFACSAIAAKHILIILDCCFSGVAAVTSRTESKSTPNEIDDNYLRRITEKHAWQILTAGDTDDLIADSGLRPEHSAFTSVLLDGLAGAADHNVDGLMTVTDLASYVKPLVTRQSEITTARSQIPFFGYLAGSGQGEFAFLLSTTTMAQELSLIEQRPISGLAEMFTGFTKSPDIFFSSSKSAIRPIEFDWVTIPAGEFLMGSNKTADTDANEDEFPQHTVYLPEYYIARVPVTNAQFMQFIDSTEYRRFTILPDRQIFDGHEQHPVRNVNWHQAVAFCEWAGVRLPTEAEWEKAASWDAARQIKCIYPWGDEFDAKHCTSRESGHIDTTPVGSYPIGASPYGVLDMAGNVWEWTMSMYIKYPYDSGNGSKLIGADTDLVLRGGSWLNRGYYARCTSRNKLHPYDLFDSSGFRVALSSLDN